MRFLAKRRPEVLAAVDASEQLATSIHSHKRTEYKGTRHRYSKSSVVMPEQYVLTHVGLQRAGEASAVQQSQKQSLAPPEPQRTLDNGSDFLDLHTVAREVHALGAMHLDKKHDAKTLQRSQLSQLGFKLPKPPRLSRFTIANAYITVACTALVVVAW
jgi:hypothetical protein